MNVLNFEKKKKKKSLAPFLPRPTVALPNNLEAWTKSAGQGLVSRDGHPKWFSD